MKKILVPTDFSVNATNALDYAIELARLFDGSIHLLHTYLVNSSTGSFINVENFIIDDAEKMMQEAVQRIQKKWPKHPKITYQILRGYPIPLIASLSKNFDLIVMGSQGESRLKEIFLGSTTNGVIKNSLVPLLAIPGEFSFRPIKNIVFAVDDQEINDEALLAPLKELALLTGAKIKVLHAHAEQAANIAEEPPIQVPISDVAVSYHFSSEEGDTNKIIGRFLREVKADLLCMIPRKRSFINKLFFRSVTKREVFQSEVPVLVLHDGIFSSDED